MTFSNETRRHVSQCASTNDLARAWALDTDNPAPHGAAVSADFQTAGRGRRGRVWQAAPGECVLLSVILRPAFPLSEAGHLAFAAGLAVSDVLAELGVIPALKWPNDVLLEGKKAAGVLVETVGGGEHWAAIVGIGVNVNTSVFPSGLTYAVPPTSLLLETGLTFDVADLTDALVQSVPARAAQDWQTTLSDWRKRMATEIILQRGTEMGTFIDVNDGAARVLLPGGTFASWTNVDTP